MNEWIDPECNAEQSMIKGCNILSGIILLNIASISLLLIGVLYPIYLTGILIGIGLICCISGTVMLHSFERNAICILIGQLFIMLGISSIIIGLCRGTL